MILPNNYVIYIIDTSLVVIQLPVEMIKIWCTSDLIIDYVCDLTCTVSDMFVTSVPQV